MRKTERKNQGIHWCNPVTRGAVMSRDGWACVYCGSTESLGLDHLKPVNRGGSNKPTNLVTCCMSCNAAKGDKRWKQFAADANVVAMINRKRYLALKTRRRDMREVLKVWGWTRTKAYFTRRETQEE